MNIRGCESDNIYPFNTMHELLEMCEVDGKSFWNYVEDYEPGIWDYLREILYVMKKSIDRGIDTEGVLPEDLNSEEKHHSTIHEQFRVKYFLKKPEQYLHMHWQWQKKMQVEI